MTAREYSASTEHKCSEKAARETCARQSYLLRGRSALWSVMGLRVHPSTFLLGREGLAPDKALPEHNVLWPSITSPEGCAATACAGTLLWARQLMCRRFYWSAWAIQVFAEQSNDLPSKILVAEHKTSARRAWGLVAEHGDLVPRERDLLAGGLDDQRCS